MKRKNKQAGRQFSVSEKLEIVQARQQGLSFRDIGKMYGVSLQSVAKWALAYERNGLAGLESARKGKALEDLSPQVVAAEQIVKEVTREEPEGGIGKVQGALYRRGFLDLARETVRQLLRRGGVEPREVKLKRRNKPPKVGSFERASPNDLWQTDIMTFMLRGQYRIYVIGFMDDNSRFIVGWGIYRFQTAANVQEVFRAAIEKNGMPKEVLSDNGRQYHSWRGKSAFTQMLTKLGIRHIRARPYHPQTCGKIESFWRNLYQECLSKVPVATFEEAQGKIGEYIEYYNFKRPHQGIGNLMPSDRFYRVDGQVKQIIAANTAAVEERKVPAPEYAPPTYLVGNIGGQELRLVAKDARVTLSAPVLVGGEVKVNGADANEAAKPAGAPGIDPGGVWKAADGVEPVRAGGGVAGDLLPVGAGGAQGGVGGAGGPVAGAQGGPSGESGAAGEKAPGAAGQAGEGLGQSAQGAGLPQEGGGRGAADNPAQCVGPVSPGGV